MNKRFYSTAEKLATVEDLIESFRRTSRSVADYDRLSVLKSIAADLRGRMGGSPHIAMIELERRIAAAVRTKTTLGYENGHLVGVGQELISRWPVVKQSLEKFGAEMP
jgi:hypothetical protein